MEPKLNIAVPDILVTDNFYAAPNDVRAYAMKQEFQHNPGDHKGQRTRETFRFPGVKERFEQLLGVRITDWEKQGYNGVFQFCVGGDPIVYHQDGQKWAAVVYLTPDAPPSAGTTLYRSKATGLRTVSAESAKARGIALSAAQSRTFDNKLLDRTAWDVVDVIGNVYNRCALWNAQLIHAASEYFGTTMMTGRLFQMFFFNAEPLPIAQPQPSSRILPPLAIGREAGIQPSMLIAPLPADLQGDEMEIAKRLMSFKSLAKAERLAALKELKPELHAKVVVIMRQAGDVSVGKDSDAPQ